MKTSTFTIIALLYASTLAGAAEPSLTRVMPRGATRGTEAELTFTGLRLDDAQEILFYEPGLTVKDVKAADERTVKAKVSIASDARLGEYKLRLRTASGVSQVRTFFVGALPVVEEKEPNNDPSDPQKIDLNVTVTGVIENEGVDCFLVEAKKGQRITAEVEGMRLATPAAVDPFVSILDEDRKELASNDDSSLFVQDSLVSVAAPKDGKYIVRIRDSSYGGSDAASYRMHVGTFPRPTAVYPAGGQAGQEISVQLIGDVSGTFGQSIKLPAEPSENFGIVPEQNGQLAPSANRMRVSPFPNVLEVEPNDSFDKATPNSAELPLAFNGMIEKPGDVDFFKFKAKKGQRFRVNCYARRLRSPLDPVISIERGGSSVASNDDAGGADSYIGLAIPDDGEYAVQVFDQLKRGGPDFVYRVEIVPDEPGLALGIPFYDQNNTSQERQAIVVPRGNRFATLVRMTRESGFGGDVALSAADLPAGLKMTCENVPGGENVVPVVFEAAADAPIAGKLVELIGKDTRPDANVLSRFEQLTTLVPNGNDPPYYVGRMNKLAVAVVDEAPFKIDIVQPKVPLVQGGSMQLKVVATRQPGFDGPIRLQMVFNPPGVSSSGTVEIESGENETTIPLNAEDGAAARKWKICVLGSSGDGANGREWASTQLADFEIAPPLLAMSMGMTSVQQGKSGQVVVNVENKIAFEGKAKVKLVGLPPNVSASPEEIEFSASDKTVTFDLKTTERAPVGQHKSLLCVATVTKDGEPMVHNLARGGVLRVDGLQTAEKPGKKSNAPAAPVAAGVSRLEKLRQEAAAAAKEIK